MYQNYVFLLLGQLSNSLAQWMDMVARPVLVIALTGSAVQLGLVTMMRGVPNLLFGPFAGLLADRMDRRILMLIAKTLNTVLFLGFALVILTGNLELWHVYVTALAKSFTGAFDQPARQALLPSMVPTSLLMNAVAVNMGSMQVMRILSASIAGLLIAFWAASWGFTDTDARAFGGVYLVIFTMSLIAVLLTFFMRVPAGGKVHRTTDSWLESFKSGFRYASKKPVILGILILIAVQSAFGMPYQQVFVPWLAMEVMGLGAQGAGYMMAVAGVGSLTGAILIATFGHKLKHRGLLIVAGLTLYGVVLAIMGLTSMLPLTVILGLSIPVLPVLMIMLAGLGQSTIMSLKNTLLLENTPNELRGRVMSLQSLDRGFTTVGSAMGGFTIALVGGPIGLAIYGCLCAVGALAIGIMTGLPKRN